MGREPTEKSPECFGSMREEVLLICTHLGEGSSVSLEGDKDWIETEAVASFSGAANSAVDRSAEAYGFRSWLAKSDRSLKTRFSVPCRVHQPQDAIAADGVEDEG